MMPADLSISSCVWDGSGERFNVQLT